MVLVRRYTRMYLHSGRTYSQPPVVYSLEIRRRHRRANSHWKNKLVASRPVKEDRSGGEYSVPSTVGLLLITEVAWKLRHEIPFVRLCLFTTDSPTITGRSKTVCCSVCGSVRSNKRLKGTERKEGSKATGRAFKLLGRPVSCSSSFLSFPCLVF
jgi:hypothetical protein